MIRVCPFCGEECRSDNDLMLHMTLRHKEDMFGCSKCATSIQPAFAWSVEVRYGRYVSNRVATKILEDSSLTAPPQQKILIEQCKIYNPPLYNRFFS